MLQASTNVVVVNAQPTVATTTVVHTSTGDYFLTLSIVMTVLCCICGGWWNLLCTISAVAIASAVRRAVFNHCMQNKFRQERGGGGGGRSGGRVGGAQ